MTTPRTVYPKEKSCQSCGIDITQHARYTRWTQCSYCYWKQRLESLTKIDDLLSQRAAIETRHNFVNQRINEIEAEALEYRNNRKSTSFWWRMLLAIGVQDRKLKDLQKMVSSLKYEAYSLQHQLESNKLSLEANKQIARHVRKRFAEANRFRESNLKRNQEENTKRDLFRESCLKEYESDYQRDYFRFRKKDYKRGNALDNYFRNRIYQKVFEVFDDACVFCGSKNDLTLDHYAIPKNEGGNFLLLVEKNGSLKVNIIPLCRSCNATKGERHYIDFFTVQKLEAIKEYHRKLLELLLNDSECLKVVEKWYR